MTVWDILAGFGLLTADVFAVLGAIGTFAILVVAFVNFRAKRRVLNVADGFFHWGGAGTGLATLSVIGLTMTNQTNVERIGFLFRFSYPTIVLLIVVSFVMLTGAILLRRAYPIPPPRRRART